MSIKTITLYHGNPSANFKPYYGGGMDYHDYGKGLYCTEDLNSAKEWACQWEHLEASYVYQYTLDLAGLNILNLLNHPPEVALAILAERRYEKKEPPLRKARRIKFIEKYGMDISPYDLVIGWRADDKYFQFLRDFLRMDISIESTIKAFHLGELGAQAVILSQKAYNQTALSAQMEISGEAYLEYKNQYHTKLNKASTILEAVRTTEGKFINEII